MIQFCEDVTSKLPLWASDENVSGEFPGGTNLGHIFLNMISDVLVSISVPEVTFITEVLILQGFPYFETR